MRIKGKIIEFDGLGGALIDKNNVRHIFSNDDLIEKNIKVNDIVYFESELLKTVDVKIYIARFISKN